jgi:phosphatidylinositol-3-phosphatase
MLARNQLREVLAVSALLLMVLSIGCGGVSGAGANGGITPPASAHVFLVVEENHSYSQVIGNASMPYLNSLAAKYGLATHYYADVHPSIGNYFMLTTGQIETLDDSFSGTVKDDNIVRELVKAKKSWRNILLRSLLGF